MSFFMWCLGEMQVKNIMTSTSFPSEKEPIRYMPGLNGTTFMGMISNTDLNAGREYPYVTYEDYQLLLKECNTWHEIVKDDCDDDTTWREVAGEWDHSDSYGVESPATVIERLLQRIKTLESA